MAKLILFDAETGELSWVKCDGLDDYYKHLKCDCIDIPIRVVGTVEYDIICDDEGLLKSNPIISAVDKNLRPMLVGNLLFSHHNIDGETTSCSESDMSNLKHHLVTLYNWMADKHQTVVRSVEYCGGM